MEDRTRNDRKGSFLVLVQFACIAVLALAGSWVLPWWSWMLFVLGLAVLGWAAVSLGVANITALPEPTDGNTLSKRGIYRYVRHPMYLSVLLCGAALAFGAPTLLRWVALVVVFIDLVIKIRYEEARLTARHPHYPELMRDVARLVPGVW